MTDRGAKLLATAILVAAASDYYDVCLDKDTKLPHMIGSKYTMKQLMSRSLIENFLDSALFDAISEIPKEIFRKKIRAMRRAGIRFPTSGDPRFQYENDGVKTYVPKGKRTNYTRKYSRNGLGYHI